MDSDVTKIICHCIEILVGDNKHDVLLPPSATETDAFLAHLRNNISLMSSGIKACPKLQEVLKKYEKYMMPENDDHVHWNFTSWCLILITELCDSLTHKTSHAKEKSVANVAVAAALSISQQKAIEKCLQFIIALGFLPNFIPGLGISLRSRAEYAGIVEHVGKDVCPRTKYKYLITSLTVLLKCTSHIVLQSIIITRHAGDLLAALFQICYAPIKKLKECESCSASKDELLHSHCEQAADMVLGKESFLSAKNLADMLEDARDCSSWTENQLIFEMWDDRRNFLPLLEQLMQKICPQVLIWELFLLQGMHHKSDKQKRQIKIPLWLRKLCRQMLTEQLLHPQGLKLFVRVMLDKATDTDLKEGVVDKTKVEAVARLISGNPFQNMPLENYIRNISAQVIDLLHSKDDQMGCIFACIASCIMLQFAEMDQSLSEKYLFKSIFKEFWACLNKAEISRCEEGGCISKEDALTVCIEDAYQIFVQSGMPTDAFALVIPFYHLLFLMFAATQNGVSFLCLRLKGLLVSLLKSCSTDDALMLLRLASFEDVTFHPVQYSTGLNCILGDSGGIVLIKNLKLSTEELLEDVNKKCAAIATILDEISNKKLRVSYFLYLLEKLTSLPTSDAVSDSDYHVKDFQNNLTLVQQLQEMAETIGEDLVEDTVKATHFIKLTLEKAVVAQNAERHEQLIFGSETVMMSLVILSTIIEYKNQLSSSHWTAMKECLPSLEKLSASSNDVILKNMCENLVFAIATHGATAGVKRTAELSSKKNSHSVRILHSKKMSDTQESSACEISSPVSQEAKHEMEKEVGFCVHPSERANCIPDDCVVEMPSKDSFDGHGSDQLRTGDNVASKQDDSSEPNHSNKTPSGLYGNRFFSDANNMHSPYEAALQDLNDSLLPVRGHGLITLSRLIGDNDKETLAHIKDILKIFVENLSDDDSYIYLASIQGLSALADVSTELVLPEVLKWFCGTNEKCKVQLKLGEVLMKICKNLGEMTVKYRNELLHAYLCGAKHNRPEIRASSLSNLGEVCKRLKFSLEPFLQEILLCVMFLLKTDPDMEVRRSAALVMTSLLQGTGKDAFMVLESEMKELYHVLKHVYFYEKDEVLKLHAQLALEEINIIVKEIFCDRPTLTKEIRILDPF